MRSDDVIEWAYDSVGDNADYAEALEHFADLLGEDQEVSREQVQQALEQAGLEYMDLPDEYTTGYKHGFVDALRSLTAAPEDTFDEYREYLERGKRERYYQQAYLLDSYLSWCADNDEVPTDAGFEAWSHDRIDQQLLEREQ